MKYYKDPNNNIFAYAKDGSQDAYIKQNLVAITDAEADAIRNPPKTLDELKVIKVTELYTAYTSANQSDISYLGTTFQADSKSQDMITSVLSVGSVPSGFYWLDIANNKVTMTYTDLQGLAGAILTRGQVAFDKLQGLKAQARAVTDASELDLIGW